MRHQRSMRQQYQCCSEGTVELRKDYVKFSVKPWSMMVVVVEVGRPVWFHRPVSQKTQKVGSHSFPAWRSV